MTMSRQQMPLQVSESPTGRTKKGSSPAKVIKESQGKKNGGMVRYKQGGCVMAGRGVRDTKMG